MHSAPPAAGEMDIDVLVSGGDLALVAQSQSQSTQTLVGQVHTTKKRCRHGDRRLGQS